MSNVQVVQQNSRGLIGVPDWVLQTSTLTRLSLRKNQIALLSRDIAQLPLLKHLDFSENQLMSLPPEIGLLTELQSVLLAFNHLSVLPRTLSLCVNIESLDLKANKLTAIPSFFTRFVRLARLDLANNVLQAKKSEFAEAAVDNPLDALWNLTSLVSLSLDGNNLHQLPPQICNLTNLERLSAAGCGLTSVPVHVCALEKMRQLLISANSIRRLPRHMGNTLLQLMELDCDDTAVSDLPASIGRCTNLTRLRMNNCPLIWPLDDLVMQGPSSVLRFLAEREAADLHAPPKQQLYVSIDVAAVPSPLTKHTMSGLSRFYKDKLKNTDDVFREKYDLSSNTSN